MAVGNPGQVALLLLILLNSAVSLCYGASSHTLSVFKAGSGTISSVPAGIHCGPACSASFVDDTRVTLAAMPASGYSLTGWGGDCSGTASRCTVILSAARTVTATFGNATLLLQLRVNGQP
ncbi:MAG: hypothetical protein WCP34_08650 [Pseudomonadota bacterium]